MKRITTLVLAAYAVAAPAAAQENPQWKSGLIKRDMVYAAIPGCDMFIARLRDAGRVLLLPLPRVKIERDPHATDRDNFFVEYWSPDEPTPDGELASNAGADGNIECSNGKFEDYGQLLDERDRGDSLRFGMRFPYDKRQRNLLVVAAAIYAYTGGAPIQVLKTASRLLQNQPVPPMKPNPAYTPGAAPNVFDPDKAGTAEVRLSNEGTVANISFAGIMIATPGSMVYTAPVKTLNAN
jgi:hypothetical protein